MIVLFFRASLLGFSLFHTDLHFAFILFLLVVVLLAVGGGDRNDCVAFGEVLDKGALSGATEHADGADIDADNDAAGRDDHQVVVALGDHAGGGYLAGLLVQAGGQHAVAAA